MKAPSVTLLPNMAKKKDKEDYITSVAKMYSSTDVMQSSLSFIFAMFDSRVGYFHPHHISVPFTGPSVPFTGPSLHDLNFYNKFSRLVSFPFSVFQAQTKLCHVNFVMFRHQCPR